MTQAIVALTAFLFVVGVVKAHAQTYPAKLQQIVRALDAHDDKYFLANDEVIYSEAQQIRSRNPQFAWPKYLTELTEHVRRVVNDPWAASTAVETDIVARYLPLAGLMSFHPRVQFLETRGSTAYFKLSFANPKTAPLAQPGAQEIQSVSSAILSVGFAPSGRFQEAGWDHAFDEFFRSPPVMIRSLAVTGYEIQGGMRFDVSVLPTFSDEAKFRRGWVEIAGYRLDLGRVFGGFSGRAYNVLNHDPYRSRMNPEGMIYIENSDGSADSAFFQLYDTNNPYGERSPPTFVRELYLHNHWQARFAFRDWNLQSLRPLTNVRTHAMPISSTGGDVTTSRGGNTPPVINSAEGGLPVGSSHALESITALCPACEKFDVVQGEVPGTPDDVWQQVATILEASGYAFTLKNRTSLTVKAERKDPAFWRYYFITFFADSAGASVTHVRLKLMIYDATNGAADRRGARGEAQALVRRLSSGQNP
jgi:hypothetical protein